MANLVWYLKMILPTWQDNGVYNSGISHLWSKLDNINGVVARMHLALLAVMDRIANVRGAAAKET
jgi:hypothetical protein